MKLRISVLLVGLILVGPSTSRADTLFVANNNEGSLNGPYTIDEFNSSGGSSTFSSSGLNSPSGLTFDSAGNLYVANYNGNNVEEFNSSSGVLSSNGTVFASGLLNPRGLAFNSTGNLFVVSDGSSIFEVTSGTGTLFATTAETPIGAAFDKSGNLYVAIQNFPGSGLEAIEKFNTNGVGTVFASSGLNYPTCLAFDKNGNLYVANEDGNNIEEYNTNGVGTVFASSGLDQPEGLAFDSAGNLYAANYGNNTIEKFNTNGVGTVFASGLNGPQGIAFAPVPEPSTWAMVAMGIGAVLGGLRLRRRWS